MATLFSYFGKSPKVSKKQDINGNSNVIKNEAIISSPAPTEDQLLMDEGEIVWAKLNGHPWWPSMICPHPSLKKCIRKDDVHVQFFGNPPSRAWVKKRDICSINNKKSHENSEVSKALEEANNALKMARKSRVDTLYACVSSDDDMENISESNKNGEIDNKTIVNNSKRARIDGESSEGDEDAVLQSTRKTPRRQSVLKGSRRLKKRAKWAIESESEESGEDDYKPSGSEETDDDASSGVDENIESDDDLSGGSEMSGSDVKNRIKKRKRNGGTASKRASSDSPPQRKTSPLSSTSVTPKASLLSKTVANSISKAQASLAKFSATNSPSPRNESMLQEESYCHEKLKFLQDGNRKDKHGRLHTDPNYDKRTLLVPDSYLKSKEVTPAMRQWWLLKRENFDTILFFKVGKFYELYHMDATVGVKELGLLYMKGSFAHAGFPEIAFSRYSDLLIQKGYKVARVEQTETPQMMNDRCAAASVKDKVVKREICAVISKGTKTYSFMEGDASDREASYLMAVTERASDDSPFSTQVGVCFVDTSIGKFHLGQFKDDKQSSRFRTLIAHYQPAQILYERNAISTKQQHILNHELASCLKDSLSQGTEFWDAKKTLKMIAENEYFNEKNKEKTADDDSGALKMPDTLKKMLSEYDSLGLTADDNYHLAISALGACIWYLKKCCIEEELLSMGQFEEYVPLDSMNRERRETQFPAKGQHLILDSVTLKNLEVVANGNGGLEGTLLEQMDQCSTSFGKRLLKQWVCAPLCNPNGIDDRLDAVDDLFSHRSLLNECKDILQTLPDLERLLRRIHSLGSLRRSKEHPDSRAILYNEDVYGKRKITNLISAIEGFEKADAVKDLFRTHAKTFKSKLLRQVTMVVNKDVSEYSGRFPNLKEHLTFFQTGFDHAKAKKDGVIIPEKGVHAAYDEAIGDISQIKGQLDSYLTKQKKRLGCKGITYWGSGKTRFQLEIPEAVLKNNTPDDFHLKSQKKGFKRYWTDEIEEMLGSLEDAEERRDAALKDTMRNLFNQFDKHRKSWEQAVECIAVLDCLLSLALYRSNADGVLCRPEISQPKNNSEGTTKPFLEILNSKHPCISRTFSGDDFILNDITIGVENPKLQEKAPRCVIVTGPNMGGKSTLMRQAGVLSIMAQVGSYVPAEKFRLTPCDRIFTRLGAQDRILHGESTFFVELSETSTILQHATEHSLVLLDELGRGTATYDGTAIASAVIRELSDSVKCRTLFSTHYHSLVDELGADPKIRLGHMACMVENEEGEESEDPTKETITFLYRFIDGSCPKSYGFNAAKLAGIPMPVIKTAYKKAKEFEASAKKSRLIKKLLNGEEIKDRDTFERLFGDAGML